MKILLTSHSKRQFFKLEKKLQTKISKLFDELEELANPRSKGKALKGNLGGFWRYRVENYRILCEINDEELLILCLEISKRDKIYK